MNLLPVSNFYPVISYRRDRKESDELLCTVWSLVMVRSQLRTLRFKIKRKRTKVPKFLISSGFVVFKFMIVIIPT